MSAQPIPADELQALVRKAQEGDTEAFGRVYDAFLTPVYRYVVFRFPEDLAEDLAAEIFVKAWEKLHTYRAYAGVPFAAWLFRIARHSVVDAYRSQRGFEELTDDLADESRSNDPRQRAEQAMSVSMVRGAISKLPRVYREILLLHYVSELTHGEVARSLRLTEGYVRILKHRALKKLEVLLPRESADIQTSRQSSPVSREQRGGAFLV